MEKGLNCVTYLGSHSNFVRCLGIFAANIFRVLTHLEAGTPRHNRTKISVVAMETQTQSLTIFYFSPTNAIKS